MTKVQTLSGKTKTLKILRFNTDKIQYEEIENYKKNMTIREYDLSDTRYQILFEGMEEISSYHSPRVKFLEDKNIFIEIIQKGTKKTLFRKITQISRMKSLVKINFTYDDFTFQDLLEEIR